MSKLAQARDLKKKEFGLVCQTRLAVDYPFGPYDNTFPPMSHHLFLLSPSDTPLYNLTHYSTKPVASTSSPLSSNLPNWSTSAFAGTLTALSGASSVSHHTAGGAVRMGGGQDRHVIQMIANASLDVIEDTMRKENTMCVRF
jgi:Sedlin, N-terminal conserved region.